MNLRSFRRIVRAGFLSFWRNGVVSFASVFVMTITLFVFGSLIFGRAVMDASLALIKDRVDINITFKTDAPEESILAIKDRIAKLSEVKLVEYVSREQALESFRERHKNNPLIIDSLAELDDNPLGASLGIKAKDPSFYEGIDLFLKESVVSVDSNASESIIEEVNFNQNRDIIGRLTGFIKATENLGLIASLVFAFIVILVTFNTVRLAIYTAKDEIGVMRLVGAGNWYIRGPFIISGMFYGIISSVFAMAIFYPVTAWLGRITESFFGGINLFIYYIDNFVQIFILLLISGLILGVFSSYLAVAKYLRA